MIKNEEWFKTVCDSYNSPPRFINNEELPGFPDDTIQINTTGQAGIETLREACIFYEDCDETFRELGYPIQSDHSLLDFGVGWGRISRFFMHTLPKKNIYGLDVMKDFVDICRDTFQNENFSVTDPFPPTCLQTGKFNFVVGYSVFSHLSEAACAAWMKEFHRILAPNGLIALTTRGRPFFDFCESLKGKGHTGYLAALSNMFSDFNEARERYDRGELVHANQEGVTGGGAMTADFYGETFIPEKFARESYSDLFILEKFLFDPSRQSHPIMFFKRK